VPASARRSDVAAAEGQRVDSKSIRRNWPLVDLTRFDIHPIPNVISRAVAMMNKMWSRPAHAELRFDRHDRLRLACFACNFSDEAAARSPRANCHKIKAVETLARCDDELTQDRGAMPHKISARLLQSQQDGKSRVQDPSTLPESWDYLRADSACSQQRERMRRHDVQRET
jgi:hypothetical protein